jgi:hypothetical protein
MYFLPQSKPVPFRAMPFRWLRFGCLALPLAAQAAGPRCEVVSGERLTPVIELYTSEGCSSCPPVDQWLSTLKGKPVVAQAFHVGYWDYIGWKDRFATAANTSRQKQIGQRNGLSGVYTPQVVRNGKNSRTYRFGIEGAEVARANIVLQRDGAVAQSNDFEARVTPASGVGSWDAYWTVTEHGHSSRVKAGENAGEFLQHDFVVRQYVPVGRYEGSQVLRLSAIPADPQHPRQVNLVVSDPQTGQPLQAASLQCG